MLRPTRPKKPLLLRPFVVSILVGESLLFLASYVGYSILLNNRDYRYYCHKKHPRILDAFYYFVSFEEQGKLLPKLDTDSWILEGKKIHERK